MHLLHYDRYLHQVMDMGVIFYGKVMEKFWKCTGNWKRVESAVTNVLSAVTDVLNFFCRPPAHQSSAHIWTWRTTQTLVAWSRGGSRRLFLERCLLFSSLSLQIPLSQSMTVNTYPVDTAIQIVDMMTSFTLKYLKVLCSIYSTFCLKQIKIIQCMQ